MRSARIERVEDRQQDHADDEADSGDSKTGDHEVLEPDVAGAEDHGVGRDSHRGTDRNRGGDEDRDDDGAGVRTDGLGDGPGDGAQQRTCRRVAHDLRQDPGEEPHGSHDDEGAGMAGKSDDLVGDDLSGAGVVHGSAERGHEGQHEDGQKFEGLERLFFGEDAGSDDEDGADTGDDVDGRQEVDIVGQDHQGDSGDEVDSREDGMPFRDGTVIGVRLTHFAGGTILDELVPEEEHEDGDSEEHRDADLGILEESACIVPFE